MASNAPIAPLAPVAPLTEFPLFQAMPMEIQCKVWAEMPIEPSFIALGYHAYPTKAEEDSPKGLYTKNQLAFRQEVMKLCKSAWLTYTLSHKLYYVPQQHNGDLYSADLFSATKGQLLRSKHPIEYGTLRLNLKSDVLSRQFELIHRHDIPHADGYLIYSQADLPPGAPRPPASSNWHGMDARRDPKVAAWRDLPHEQTSENDNLARHVHADVLIRRPGSTPTIILDKNEEPITVKSFIINLLMVPILSRNFLQTITLSLNGPGALHGVLRLVKLTSPPSTPTTSTTPPALLPSPVKYHNASDPGIRWSIADISNTIRNDGALVLRPPHILRKKGFALFRVITPLGAEIYISGTVPERDRPLETFHNDPIQWRAALQRFVTLMNGLNSPPENTPQQLREYSVIGLQYALATGLVDSLAPFQMDGLCGPNYAMGDAKVFR